MSLNPSESDFFLAFCDDAISKKPKDLEIEEEMDEQQEEEEQQEKLSEEQWRERQTAIQRAAQVSSWITAAAVQNGTPVLMYWIKELICQDV